MTAPSSKPRSSFGFVALLTAIFFAALGTACTLIGRWLPFPDVPTIRDKMEHLALHGDDYDVIFVGSSRVHFQVLPSIFDQIAHDHGLAVRSFNAAVAAMRPPEDWYILDEILRRPHKRLRWVFVEVMSLNDKGDPTLTGTGRYTYWRDWKRTRLLTRSFFEDCADAFAGRSEREPGSPGKIEALERAISVWIDNLRLFLENCSNLGRGAEWAGREMGPSKKQKAHPEYQDHWDGWAFPSIAKPWTDDPKRRLAYEHAYADLLASDQRFEAGNRVSWVALRAKLDSLQQAGITPIMIIAPTVTMKRYYPYQLNGQGPAIMDFSDPRKNPELFTLDHRLDGMHLNYAGSEIFTDEIADQFVEMLKKSGQIH